MDRNLRNLTAIDSRPTGLPPAQYQSVIVAAPTGYAPTKGMARTAYASYDAPVAARPNSGYIYSSRYDLAQTSIALLLNDPIYGLITYINNTAPPIGTGGSCHERAGAFVSIGGGARNRRLHQPDHQRHVPEL